MPAPEGRADDRGRPEAIDTPPNSNRLPAGFVERAVAELLAGRNPGRVIPHVPFEHCPGCGAALSDPANLVQEFWVSDETRFLVWCRSCRFTGTVTKVDRFKGSEVAE